MRRAGFVFASVWLVQEPPVRFMVFTFLNFASLLVHQLALPYDQPRLNQLEVVTYALLVCISALLTGYQPPYTLAVQVFIFLLIIPATVGLVVFVTRQQWGVAQARLRQLKKSTRGASTADDSQQVLPAASDDLELTQLDVGMTSNPALSLPRSRESHMTKEDSLTNVIARHRRTEVDASGNDTGRVDSAHVPIHEPEEDGVNSGDDQLVSSDAVPSDSTHM